MLLIVGAEHPISSNVGQGAVSQPENRSDMLLSTLRRYLTATGAENPRIVVTVNGNEIELAL